jgi:hypothetical protein
MLFGKKQVGMKKIWKKQLYGERGSYGAEHQAW